MTIDNLINWLQEAEDNNTWLVSTQSVKRHLEKIKETEQCTIPSVSKRYQVTDIQLADWESVVIGDTETNKVVCHFLTENGFDEAVKMANKIADYINVC